LFFRSGAAPSGYGSFSDTGAQGFYIDDVSYKDWNSGAPGTTLASYAATFEPAVTPPTTVYVNATWAGLAVGVDPDGTGSADGIGYNAFATIQDGLNAVASGGTVYVAAGTYAENVLVNKPVTLLGANFDVNPVTGTRGPETVVEPGLNSSYDTDSVFLVEASNVTIEGFTIQGSNPDRSGGFNLDSATTVYAAAGVSSSANVNISGLTVQNNIIRDFTQVGVSGDTSDGTVSTGNFITDNVIKDVPNNGDGGFFGKGVLISHNFYAKITGNTISNVRTGIQTDNNYLSAGSFAPSISNNIVSASVKGIYYNLQYESASAFTIADNTITQADGSVSPAYNVGLLIQSIESSVQSSITGNDVSGFLYGVELAGNNTTNTVTVHGGQLNGNTYGVWATNNDYFYPADFNTAAALDGVTITNSTEAGIWVDSTSPNSDNAFNTTSTVSLAISGGTAVIGGPVGLKMSGGLTAITGHTLNDTSFSGQSGSYITLADGAELGHTIDATGASFDGQTGATATLAQNFAIEDRITHALDDATLGFVRVKAGNVFVTPSSGSIQRGVNVASSGDTVNVHAGTYAENVNVDKSVTLLGAKAGVNGNHASRGSGESVLTALDSNTRLDLSILHITASNVTVDGFTIDGHNAARSSNTVPLNGLDSGAVRGISNLDNSRNLVNVQNVQVENNVIQNLAVFGIYLDSDTGGLSTGNAITDNKIDNLPAGDPFYGAGILLADNFYASVTGNVLTRTFDGIVINHYGDSTTGSPTMLVSDNQVESSDSGIYLLDAYAGTGQVSITGNTMTTVSGSTTNRGLVLEGIAPNAVVTVSDNSVSGANVGVFLWSNPGGVMVSGGTLSHNDIGVLASNYDARTGIAADVASQATISGVTISANRVGVFVEDSPSASGHAPVSLDIGSGVSISGGTTRLVVSGATASALDASTQGNWQGVYGRDGYNVIGGPASYPSYAQVKASGEKDYVWRSSTSDQRALQVPGGGREAATWYSGTSYTVDVNLTDGQTHQLALYLLDWDHGGLSERIDVSDAASGAALGSWTVSSFSGGEYLVFNVSGDMTIRITRLAGADCDLSGLFFDTLGGGSPPSGSATFVEQDTTTHGNWIGVYGRDGYNVIGGPASDPAYAKVAASGKTDYVWRSSTTDPRALEVPGGGREAATWYSPTSYTVDVNLTDGQTHRLALYFLDWDKGGLSEQIDVLDAASGASLGRWTVSSFADGQYLVLNVSGHVTIKITRLAGADCDLSGLFFDTLGDSTPPASVTLVKQDTKTQGTWQGVYGADGYNMAGGTVKDPAYAKVTPSGETDYVWRSSTTDPRALQVPGGGREAATWYSRTSYDVDVNLTDGQTHGLALYFLDWDKGGLSERIDVLDAKSGVSLGNWTVSSFGGGEYLVLNVSGHVTIKITRLAGADCDLSGLFFDPQWVTP
jgi:hypothetical protein